MIERAIREIVGEMHDVTCHTCKPSHKMRVFKSIEYDVLDKIRFQDILTLQGTMLKSGWSVIRGS